jgi:hypothetical protein
MHSLQPVHKVLKQLRPIGFMLLLMLPGLILRLWFVSVNELNPQLSPADDGDYYQRALRFATTGEYIDDFWLIRPPLHVFLFAFMLRVSILLGDVPGLMLIRGAQITLSLLAIPLGYGLARRLFSSTRAGIIFALLLAVWYPLVELPAHLFTEPLFVFLFLLHLWLLARWRDEQHWSLLAAAGLSLALTALTRSVALYGVIFVVGWLLLECVRRQHNTAHTRQQPEQQPDQQTASTRPTTPSLRAFLGEWAGATRKALPSFGRVLLLFLVPCALVILPWTYRNYVVYQRFIPIDTIGSVNLWLHMEKREEKGVEILKTMPQRDRHVFSVQETKRMFLEDPLHFWNMLWRNAWLHFLHIWKGQFIEDFLLKSSFYGRPLRAVWPLGMAGDLLWFVFTLGGLAALVAPLREGMFRWLALGWVSYTILTVMIFHVEPRYLMPLWVILMLYGSWALGEPGKLLRLLRRAWPHGVVALVLVLSFLGFCFTYRNYPATIATGIQREWHHAAGKRAFASGNYEEATSEFRQALDAQPIFVSSRAYLALALVAAGETSAAQEVIGSDTAQHALVARGAIARARGESDHAAKLFTRAEKKAGEDVQAMTLEWLRPPPVTFLELGSGGDFGYIAGFSGAEQTETPAARSYRWLQGEGRIALPMPRPLQAESVLALRIAAASHSPTTVLRVEFEDSHGKSYTIPAVQVKGGQWRSYYLPVPAALEGEQELTVVLDAPIFIPAHYDAETNDIRPVSLMVNAVWVQSEVPDFS